MASTSVKQWVLAYYTGYQVDRYPIESIDWSCLTHIAFSRLKANPDGTLALDFDDATGHGAENAKKLAKAAADNGVTPLLMLGGEGAGPNIAKQVAVTDTMPEARANLKPFVEALIKTMDDLGFFGIDLDWEDYRKDPKSEGDKDVPVVPEDLVALAQELRRVRPNIILTFPAPVTYFNHPGTNLELHMVAPYVNKFSVMSYAGTFMVGGDWESWFVSPLTGAAEFTPAAIDDSLQQWASAGVPKNKLLMGIGAFAVCYPPYITAPRQKTFLDDSHPDDLTGGDPNFLLGDMLSAGGPLDQFPGARTWDPAAQQPYLSLPTATAFGDLSGWKTTRYIPYDDDESIIAKGKWSRDNGYGGAIVWTLQGLLPSPSKTVMKDRSPDALVQALRTGFLP